MVSNINLHPYNLDYYKQTFHWQTDGWLSSKSAQVYEVGQGARLNTSA